MTEGFPRNRITVVHNSIDTGAFRKSLQDITVDQILAVKQHLSIPDNAQVGLFCGSLYPERQLDFLITSAALIRRKMPEFNLVAIGGGSTSEEIKMKAAAQTNNWVHYLGPCFDFKKAACFRMADVLIMPGALGLGILDAFTASLPMLTTQIPSHGPEIDYLEHGINGMIFQHDAATFAESVIDVLRSPILLRQLRAGAAASGRRYTIEKMVENFTTGVLTCLECTVTSSAV